MKPIVIQKHFGVEPQKIHIPFSFEHNEPILVHVEPGAYAELIWEYHLLGANPPEHTQSIVVGDGARIQETILIDEASFAGDSFRDGLQLPYKIHRKLSLQGSDVEWNSVVKCHLNTSDKHVIFTMEHQLLAPRSRLTMKMTSRLHNKACIECYPVDLHTSHHTESKWVWHSALYDAASIVFSGMLDVKADAKEVIGSQHNRNLLLSREALVKAEPRLQVIPHAVSCSHGSASESVNPYELYALQSRGFSLEQAQELVVEGFLS